MKKLILAFMICMAAISYCQIPLCVAPLKIGNFWKYYDIGYKKTNKTIWFISYRVVDTATINNSKYYKVQTRTNWDIGYSFYRLTDSGYYAAYQPGDNEFIYYKQKAKYNDTWQQHYWNANRGILYSCVIDTNNIDMYGQTYKAKFIQNTDSNLTSDLEIWTEEIGLINQRVELSEYTLGGWCIDGIAHGDTTVTAVDDISQKINTFALHQNYPNPFNPATIISFETTGNGFITLKVYDILGKEVKTLISKIMPAGTHQIKFEAGGLPSGIYFYKLTNKTNTLVKKMMLLK